jgi:DNA end-binding protein Ku
MFVPVVSEGTPSTPAADAGAVETALTSGPRGRATWSGLLKLSLVAVPVKAYPAIASAQQTHFNQLHAGCGQRIRYEKHCPLHGKVDTGAIVSGYQYAHDQYVVIDEAELEQLRPARDKALCLERFLDPAQVDPLLFSGRSLYLLPDGQAAHHPYLVVAHAMHQRRKWGLSRVVLGGRRYLGVVRPVGRLLTLHLLHYPAHVRASAACAAEVRTSLPTDDELKLAGLLIDTASAVPLSWSDYRDDTAEQLAALVEAKLQDRPLPVPVAEEATVLTLLDALKRSVAQETQPPRSAEAPAASRGKKRNPRRSA